MDTCTNEQALRREAIRRCLAGERHQDICRDLERSPSWLDKWWSRYRHNPHTDFADQSRAPHRSQQTSLEVVRTVVAVRKILEAAQTPQTRYGLIGPAAVQEQLRALKVKPLLSLSTIGRILHAQGLTHPVGAGQAIAYYPWPLSWDVNAIQATDIITRHVRGGELIENFHTIDHYSHAVCMSQHADQSSATARAHLLRAWAKLGVLPQF